MLTSIQTKIDSKTPISVEDAVYLYRYASLEQLKALASQVKSRFHPVDSATYLIMAIVNYTNICVAKCDYCSFYRLPHDKEGYLLTLDQVCEKIESMVKLGGKLVGFNGGFHPKLRIHDYAELFHGVRQRYPNLEFYEMTVAEFMFSSKVSKVSYDEGALILKESGTRWVTGGGAEILSNSFRKRHSPGKYTAEDYYNAQEAILKAGLGSTATMVIGFDETLEERFDHLESLRNFQDKVQGKLASLLCWTYKPFNNEFGGVEVSNEEYLRWLAICRIYLHNFKNIRTSVLTKNAAALDGLSYGANDFDLPTEDEVTQKAGATISHEFDKILGYAKTSGFKVSMREPWTVN
jgi:cyclic dehypoxanthinyl futalosine synthase